MMYFYKSAAVTAVLLSCLLLTACQPADNSGSSVVSETSVSSETESSSQAEATPTPTPAATPEVSSESQEESSSQGSTDNACFENSAFVGNSMLEDLNMFGIIDNADFYAKTGLTVSSVFTDKTVDGSAPIMDEVTSKKYDKVFLMFGLNELGWSYSSVFTQDYGKIIDTLRESNPEVEIYVQSLFPVSKKRSDQNLYGVTNERIVEYNDMLKELCTEKDVHYVDVYSSMVTEDGALADGASPDGVHPNMEYCETWVQYLRDHC